jgi:HK97 family phage prohead protease
MEYRAGAALELRASRADGPPRIRGYAAVFEILSLDLGGFREKIARGTFTRTLRGQPDVRALVGHDPNLILGRTESKTLQLWEDSRGLGFEIDPPDTQLGRDTVTSIARGDLSQASFAFRVVPGGERWSEDATGGAIRTLLDVDLFDVSVVAFPATVQTSAEVVAGARRRERDVLDDLDRRRRRLRLAESEI